MEAQRQQARHDSQKADQQVYQFNIIYMQAGM